MTGIEPLLVGAAVLVLLGVLASKISARLGVPALVLFIGVGMLAGTDGPGGIAFDDFDLVQNLGIVALAYILYDGGLSTSWRDIRPVLRPGLGLATLGVAITAGISGTVAAWALDLPLQTGLLLGAIVSSTDAAAVFSVLRSRSVGLSGQVRPLLELESGSNDPMAVFLTIGLIELITEPGTTVVELVPLFITQMAVGAAVGLAVAVATVAAVNRLRLEYDGLYPVVTLTVVLFTYAIAALLGGSGFLAVYIAGIVVGSAELVHKKSLGRFHDALAWLSQIAMFLVLGLLVTPSRLVDVAVPGMVVAVTLVLVARPVSVMVTLAFSRFSLRERTMISWVGLRGAVPIILAIFPLVAGVEQSERIFDVVFFAVLVSVLVQGTTIPVVARWLRVDAPLTSRPAYPLEAVSSAQGGATLHELEVGLRAPADGRSLIELPMPETSLIVLISRADQFIVPQGATMLHSGDTVLVLADAPDLATIRPLICPDARSDPPDQEPAPDQ